MSQSKEAATSEFGTKLTSRNVRHSSGYKAEADMPKISPTSVGEPQPTSSCQRLDQTAADWWTT